MRRYIFHPLAALALLCALGLLYPLYILFIGAARPGASIQTAIANNSRRASNPASSISGASSSRPVVSSDNFRISYPAKTERRDVEAALQALETGRAQVLEHLAAASLNPGEAFTSDVYVHETTGDFVGVTGQPPWVGAATRGRRIELQPLDVLRRRGVLSTTLRHEFAHAVIEALGHGRTPRWLAEGLALHLSGEGPALARATPQQNISTEELERRLDRPSSAQEMRALYSAAYREVAGLIASEGETEVWKRISRY